MTKQLKANNRELGKEAKSYKKAIRSYENERFTSRFLKPETEENDFSKKLRRAYIGNAIKNYRKTIHSKSFKTRLGRYLGI